jgi:hypothetical protein
MDAFHPAQTTELVAITGAKKARMRSDNMFINSFIPLNNLLGCSGATHNPLIYLEIVNSFLYWEI